MTLPRIKKLHQYWAKHPRVEWLVAAYLKYEPKQEQEESDIAAAFGLKSGQTVVG